jgi:hypothetical protein
MRAHTLAALALLGACGPAVRTGTKSPGVSLRVVPDRAAAGDSVTLLLSNGAPGGIGYNLCTSALERRSGSDWQAVSSDRICTMELRTLPSGEEARYPMGLPAGLAPGEYRVHTTIEILDGGSRDEVRSEPFRIGP